MKLANMAEVKNKKPNKNKWNFNIRGSISFEFDFLGHWFYLQQSLVRNSSHILEFVTW